MERAKQGLQFARKLYIDWATYKKARKLYSKRRGFKAIYPDISIIQLLRPYNRFYKIFSSNLWNYKLYTYKGRIFIFKPFCPIAICVISHNKAYNPLVACGAIFSDVYNRIFKTPLLLKLLTMFYLKEWH